MFEERRKLGRTVRRKWFEYTSKRLYTEIYPFQLLNSAFQMEEFEGADNDIDRDDITGSSAVGEIRVMMTRCVGAAWGRFYRERREVVVRSFCCIGASLPIDGSFDGEISIGGLPTPHLVTALKDWKTEEHLLRTSVQ